MKDTRKYTEKERSALNTAIEKGVPFTPDYPLPYTVETIDAKKRKEHEWHSPGYCFSWQDTKKHGNGIWEVFPTVFYRVLFGGEVPMSNFFPTFQEARDFAEGYNVRHFEVAARSTNTAHPVLL
jgi:hypothetical protein